MEKPFSEIGKAQFVGITLEAQYDDFEITHPALLLSFNGDLSKYKLLHYKNTLVKTYDPEKGYDVCDHIAINLPAENDTLMIQICDETHELYEFLIEAEYPYFYQPLPEPEVMEWAIEMQQQVGWLAIEAHLKGD